MKTEAIKKAGDLLSKSASYIWDKISKNTKIVKVSIPHNQNMVQNGLIEAEKKMSKLAHRLNKDEKFNIRSFEVQGKTNSKWGEFKSLMRRTKNIVKIPVTYTHETNITSKEIEMIICFETQHNFEKSDFLRLKHEELHSEIYIDVLNELFNVQKTLHGRFITYESDKKFLPKAAS